MPYNYKLKTWHHSSRFFAANGKRFEIVGTKTTDEDCFDTIKDETGKLFTVKRNYFERKEVIYLDPKTVTP